MDKIGVAAALRNYFGLKHGQTISDFVKEIKELSEQERIELATDCAKALGKELEVQKN